MIMLWRGFSYLLLGGFVYLDNTTRLPLQTWLKYRETEKLIWQACGFIRFPSARNY